MASHAFDSATASSFGDEAMVTAFGPGGGLPHFIQPVDPILAQDRNAFADWLSVKLPAIETLIAQVGAVVLRGFPVFDTPSFGAVAERFGTADLSYTGGASPRRELGSKVFEATHSPADAVIGLHQEMTYLPQYPSRLAFYCRMPAASGGETIVADMRRYTAGLPGSFRRQLEERGVLYTRNFRTPEGGTGDKGLDTFHKSWTDAFSTNDPAEAVARARGMGLGAEWLANGSLSVTYRATGFVRHPATGESLSFNQIPSQSQRLDKLGAAHQRHYGDGRPLPYQTAYGDGSPIAWEDVEALRAGLRDLTVTFPWSTGDIMILDNFLTAHGRNVYTGARNVQVALLR